MSPKAKHDLKAVSKLLDGGKVAFTARSRSTKVIIKLYKETGQIKSEGDAERFIVRAIKELTPAHFFQSVLQWGDPKCVADVYGLIFDSRPWYVKFLIDEGVLEQISFHPPEKKFTTTGGIVIPKGDTDYED